MFGTTQRIDHKKMNNKNLTLTESENAPELRIMVMSDLSKVLKIISAHDNDDGESAETDYQNNGIEHQYVLISNGRIIGITGYRPVDETDETYWLSWTYLEKAYQGRGFGRLMLSQLFDQLSKLGARKIFVKVSDYEDKKLGSIYHNAFKTYRALGFTEEVINNDFYDDSENQHILSLTFNVDADFDDANPENNSPKIMDEKPFICFNGLYEIAETDGAYTFSWTVKKKKGFFGKPNFTTEDLILGLNNVKSEGGRKVFLTFPSNLPLIHKPLQAAGFEFVGRLTDYYERGVHEFHFSHDLKNLS